MPRAAELAASLDAEASLAPWLHELFADLQDLGVRARDVRALLRGQRLAPAGVARVLDLGCGKGAVALGIAQDHAAQVLGVDGVPGFIAHATAQAQARDLPCQFRVADLVHTAAHTTGQDLVLLLALGEVLGAPQQAMEVLRSCVRPGGLIVVDEAYGRPGSDYPGRAEVLAERLGPTDTLIRELVYDGPAYQAWLRQATLHLAHRAERLAAHTPAVAQAARAFAARQRAETLAHAEELVGVLWLIRCGAPTKLALRRPQQ